MSNTLYCPFVIYTHIYLYIIICILVVATTRNIVNQGGKMWTLQLGRFILNEDVEI